MPRMTAAEQDTIYADIQTRFAAGESLTAIRAIYPGKFTLGELKQIVQGPSKRAADGLPNAGSNIAPKSGTGRGPR